MVFMLYSLPDLSSSLSARWQPVIREGHLDAPRSCGGAGVLEVAGWAALGQTTAQDLKVGTAATPLQWGGPPPGNRRGPGRVLFSRGGGRRLGKGAAFEGRRLPVGWTGSARAGTRTLPLVLPAGHS